jgi:hypothetical protein
MKLKIYFKKIIKICKLNFEPFKYLRMLRNYKKIQNFLRIFFIKSMAKNIKKKIS